MNTDDLFVNLIHVCITKRAFEKLKQFFAVESISASRLNELVMTSVSQMREWSRAGLQHVIETSSVRMRNAMRHCRC